MIKYDAGIFEAILNLLVSLQSFTVVKIEKTYQDGEHDYWDYKIEATSVEDNVADFSVRFSNSSNQKEYSIFELEKIYKKSSQNPDIVDAATIVLASKSFKWLPYKDIEEQRIKNTCTVEDSYKNNAMYKAFVDMYSYNYSTDALKVIYDRIVEEYESHDAFEVINIGIGDVDDDWYDNEGLNFVWGMLVLMFGEYGSSPRTGWLVVSQELIDFLKTMLKDLE